MAWYSIPDPYRKGNQYYINHYVCLWEVTKKEIVGHWEWDQLATNKNWYKEVIVPAFTEFREKEGSNPAPSPARASMFDMSKVMESLPSKSSAFAICTHSHVEVRNKPISPDTLWSGNSDVSFEEYDDWNDDGTYDSDDEAEEYDDWNDDGAYDSDDEVEEANLNDDIIKMIEGLW